MKSQWVTSQNEIRTTTPSEKRIARLRPFLERRPGMIVDRLHRRGRQPGTSRRNRPGLLRRAPWLAAPRAEHGGAQGLRNFSTKRSLVPRRSPAALGESFQSRASDGLRRKSAESASLKPAFSIWGTTALS